GYFQFYYNVVGNKLLIAILLSILVTILDGIGLTMFMPLLQAVSGGSASSSESMGNLHFITDAIAALGIPLTLGTVLAIVAVLFSLKGFAKFSELNYQAKVIQFFMKRIRHELVNNLQKTSYRGFTKLDAGKIQNIFIAEVQRMSQAVKSYLSYSQQLFMLGTYVLLALLANYQFAILVAISSGLANLLYRRINRLMKKASLEISEKGHHFNSYMIQGINYFKYLKSTNYLHSYSRKLDEVIDKTEHINKKTGLYSAISMGIREPITMLIVVIVIFIQLNWLGGNLGSIILSLLLFYRALTFLMGIQFHWQSFIQNTGAMRTVADLSEIMKSDNESHGNIPFISMENEIKIENTDVSYGSAKVLKNINITIPKNNTIALVGPSGSGKTTLANIIIGLITPDSGQVLLDGIPLLQFDLPGYRSKIGYISQDSVIFNDDIYNNITFWSERTPENENRFWEVIKMAYLDDFVMNQPEKELTRLGDNGILISGGQKQRISIAREMFKKVEIMILDEATSALDSETEFIIQENIENLHGRYTMIVIAHRLSTIRNVDTIYLLDKGEISVSGNFETMIESSDKFKRMVDLQGLTKASTL
ncbi:MAG: ABC transporter ATP-binding protein, partial [Ginsengibacter sp.]